MDMIAFGFAAIGALIRAFLGFVAKERLDLSKFSLSKVLLTVALGTVAGGAIAVGFGLDNEIGQLLAGFAGSEALKKILDLVTPKKTKAKE